MGKNNNLKENLNSFIEERLQQSYRIASNNKEYKEEYKKLRELEEKFLTELKDDNFIIEYDEINNCRLFLDSIELQEAYLLGFRDSNIINVNN